MWFVYAEMFMFQKTWYIKQSWEKQDEKSVYVQLSEILNMILREALGNGDKMTVAA